jgi:hypothetical protein
MMNALLLNVADMVVKWMSKMKINLPKMDEKTEERM